MPQSQRQVRVRPDGKVRCAKCKRWKAKHLFNIQRGRAGSCGCQAYCKYCDLKRQRETPRREYKRRQRTLAGYGLTEAQYRALLIAQEGKCAICCTATITDSIRGRLSIDHNHTTNKVRGLLCGLCNKAIGLLRDDPATAQKVVAYLQRYL